MDYDTWKQQTPPWFNDEDDDLYQEPKETKFTKEQAIEKGLTDENEMRGFDFLVVVFEDGTEKLYRETEAGKREYLSEGMKGETNFRNA